MISRRELLLFIGIGAVCAAVDFSLTILFQYEVGLAPGYAKIIGFIVGTLLAFYGNSRWTFQSKITWEMLGQVLVLYGITFVVQEGIYAGLSSIIPQKKLYSLGIFIFAQAVATTVNFLVQKLVIFHHHSGDGNTGNHHNIVDHCPSDVLDN